jgi:hypothetical protein
MVSAVGIPIIADTFQKGDYTCRRLQIIVPEIDPAAWNSAYLCDGEGAGIRPPDPPSDV